MMSPAAMLPPELCDHVLDCLHDDQLTLRQCALIARNWLPRAQHHIFRSIYIDWSNCTQFTRLLASSPELGFHVSKLEIEGAFGIFSMDRLHGATLDAWLRAIPDSFPRQLCNLTKLELALITIDAELVARVFGRLTGITQLTLFACAVTSFDVFVQLLSSYPCLTHLNIAFTQEWETRPRSYTPTPSDAVLPHLQVIELTSSCDNFKVPKWLISQDLHHSIHTFSCSRVPFPSLPALADTLSALAPHLQNLRVGFGDQASPFDDMSIIWSHSVFTPLPALTSLTLDVHTGRLAAVPYTMFLLSRLSVPALRVLTFVMIYGDSFEASAQFPWERIAEASARIARGARLERVMVHAREKSEDADGVASGVFSTRGYRPVDIVEMEELVLDAFARQGMEKLIRFSRRE